MNSYNENQELESEIIKENPVVESNTISEFFDADDFKESQEAAEKSNNKKANKLAHEYKVINDAVNSGFLDVWKETINRGKATYANLYVFIKNTCKKKNIKFKISEGNVREFLQTDHGFKKRTKK